VLGGDCLHFGCVPSKTLIRTAQAYQQAKNLSRFGLPEIELPPVDFSHVASRIQSVIQSIQEHDSIERFCSLGAQVELGAPEFVDEHSLRLDGRTLSAKTWVLATGSSPGAPAFEGLDRTPYLTNRDIFSLPRLPSSLIVVGAGPIAIEMAQAFARLGSRVQVIQRSGQILSKEDTDMAELVMDRLQAEGVAFHLKAQVLSFSDHGSEREVRFRDAQGQEQSLRAEEILVALGRDPNIEGLGLDKAGLEYTRKGIPVDQRMRTSQRHIYAAGDVTGQYLFTHAAGYEGGIIVSNAAFHLPRKVDYTLLPWCTYTDPELASIGYNEKRATEAGLDYEVYSEEFRSNDRSLAEGEESGRIKMLINGKGNPIGVQIFGPQAGELISEWVAALNGGVKLTTLAGAVHPYPTLAEVNKGVVGRYLQPKIFSETMQKALKFFFHFKGRACQPR